MVNRNMLMDGIEIVRLGVVKSIKIDDVIIARTDKGITVDIPINENDVVKDAKLAKLQLASMYGRFGTYSVTNDSIVKAILIRLDAMKSKTAEFVYDVHLINSIIETVKEVERNMRGVICQ